MLGPGMRTRVKIGMTSQAATLIDRFNERVLTAQRASPPAKHWVRKAVRRQGASRCAVRLRRLSYDVILRYGDALADLFVAYPDDVLCIQPYEFLVGYRTPGVDPIDPVRVLTEPAEWTDEWGTRWEHAAGGVGASPISFPLRDWSQLDDYLEQRMPDPSAPGRLDGALPSLRSVGPVVYYAGMAHMALFERLHCLRGMENTLEDFYAAPQHIERLLDALTDYYLEIIRGWGGLEDVDCIFMSDDWGTQSSLMVSPEMWRRFFAARYRRLCDEAHRQGLDVMFHSCGHVLEIIGDLIDAGVDIIDPLQSEAMDLRVVAREYGGKVAFCGGLSDQAIAGYTPVQVRDEVRRTIDLLGVPYANAYIVGTSNTLMPEIPLANIEALFEACHGR
jgi:uroporphyrinogen decarboxylase